MATVIDEARLYSGFVRLTRVTLDVDWAGRRYRLEREVHDHGHVAAIVPVDPGRGMGLLVRQFRTPAFLDGGDGWLWEIPAGMLDGEAPRDCAIREAHEETGVHIAEVGDLGVILTSPGLMTERVHLFWGAYSGPPLATIGGKAGEGELIEVHELPLCEIAERLDAGKIVDAKSAVGLYRLRTLRPELFSA